MFTCLTLSGCLLWSFLVTQSFQCILQTFLIWSLCSSFGGSQGLFDGVERERNFRFTRSRSSTIFQHPAIRHFDLQHLPVGESDTELEEHVIQQFIAAAMGRRQHIFQSETQRSRSIPRGHRQFLVFPVPNAPPGTAFSSSSAHSRGENEPAPHRVMSSSVPHDSNEDAPGQSISLFPVQTAQSSTFADGPSRVTWANRGLLPENWISEGQPSLGSQDGAGPSDFQSFSESFKSRLSSLSMRYRESISRSARGWTEKWFSRSSSMDGPGPLGSEVQREVNAGVAGGSRVLDHLENSGSTGSRLAP
ncbi:hypothetical protein Dimus_007445 [Dionaea muscipula]